MIHRAFSLIELLVVISIIAILIVILLPAISGVIETSRRLQCGSNLRTLGQGLSMYIESGDQLLPYARWVPDLQMERDAPFDIIATELGIQLPQMISDGYSTDQPFACASDRMVAPETGFSYIYTPFSFYSVLPEENRRRTVTRMFTTNSWSVLIEDRFGYHINGTKNILRADGAVEPFDIERGLGVYEP
ncbi:MAG: prepilin-type N-terminal cleavage/methylation domain-containing protein [Phycisphaerales bacterium]